MLAFHHGHSQKGKECMCIYGGDGGGGTSESDHAKNSAATAGDVHSCGSRAGPRVSSATSGYSALGVPSLDTMVLTASYDLNVHPRPPTKTATLRRADHRQLCDV